MMKLEPGMRVRCVSISGMTDRQVARASVLTVGQEYVVTQSLYGSIKIRGSDKWWGDWRFKPVIRVKAKSEPVAGSNRATYSSSDLAVYSMRRLRDFAAGVHADSKP